MRASNPVKEVRHVGLMGEELAAFLNTLKATDPKQFEGVEKALHALVPRVTNVDVKTSAVGEVELRLVEDGIAVPARLVSEGTLRMLGLLAAVSGSQPPTLVAFEEPENGIHPRRIRLLAEFFLNQSHPESETQFIVTTHSALLPDLLPGDALFVCKRVGNCTEISPMVRDPLYRKQNIDRALEDDDEPPLKPSQRILRGDFDG
jgi:predicted ATPase